MHYCDNELCGNYDHLQPGTYQENSLDARDKGRLRAIFEGGERHWNSRLTDAVAIEILQRVIAGETQSSLAREFDIDPSAVSRLVSGKRWGHLKAVV